MKIYKNGPKKGLFFTNSYCFFMKSGGEVVVEEPILASPFKI